MVLKFVVWVLVRIQRTIISVEGLGCKRQGQQKNQELDEGKS